MGRNGLEAAYKHGMQLPVFSGQKGVEESLYSLRDNAVRYLIKAVRDNPKVQIDYSIDSLLHIEQWYFASIPQKGLRSFLYRRYKDRIAQCCAFYFGEVVIRNVSGSKWIVKEFPFIKGRYVIGVQKELCTMILSSFKTKLEHPLNETKDSMWRTYQHYFVQNSGITIMF